MGPLQARRDGAGRRGVPAALAIALPLGEEISRATIQESQRVPRLFEKVKLRGLELRNRIVISPMCQYSARDGFTTDYHLVHYGRFALGGAGLVFIEATAVVPEGRITHGDVALWSDDHIAGLARIAAFVKGQGAAAGLQL